MMLVGFGLESPGYDAHDARGFGSESGPEPADAHDARGFGPESAGQHQLMLMMLGGLGLQTRASTS